MTSKVVSQLTFSAQNGKRRTLSVPSPNLSLTETEINASVSKLISSGALDTDEAEFDSLHSGNYVYEQRTKII